MLPGIDPYVLADPAQTLAADRPARFLRVAKAVSIPDEDLYDIDNTAFGVTTRFGMKEIVGYTPIEPDGSVMLRVPANAALMISVVDENGMRITQRHKECVCWCASRAQRVSEYGSAVVYRRARRNDG
jgi:hypothetical protein